MLRWGKGKRKTISEVKFLINGSGKWLREGKEKVLNLSIINYYATPFSFLRNHSRIKRGSLPLRTLLCGISFIKNYFLTNPHHLTIQKEILLLYKNIFPGDEISTPFMRIALCPSRHDALLFQ